MWCVAKYLVKPSYSFFSEPPGYRLEHHWLHGGFEILEKLLTLEISKNSLPSGALRVRVAQSWCIHLFKFWMLVVHLRVGAQHVAVWGAAIQLLQANWHV
jgi:hypothetical protein